MSLHGALTSPEERARLARWTLVVALSLFAATPATAGVLIRVFPEMLPAGSASRPRVHQIARIGNEIWIAAENGVYRVVGQRLEPVLPTVSARSVLQVDGTPRTTLVGAADGLRVQQGGEWVRLSFPVLPAEASPRCSRYSRLDIPVVALAERDGVAWLGTDCGLAFWDGEAVHWFDAAPVSALRRVGRDIWVGGSGSLFRIDETGDKVPIVVDQVRIERIDHAAGAIWLVASSGPGSWYDRLLRVEVDRASPVYGEGFRFVYRVVPIRPDDPGEPILQSGGPADRAWLATDAGVFEYSPSGMRPIAIKKLAEAVNTIAEWDALGGQRIRWVGSSERAYRQVGRAPTEILPVDDPLTHEHEISVKDIVTAGGAAWLRTDEEVFRYDEGVSLFAQPDSVPFAGGQLLFGRTLSLADYGYRNEMGADPYGGAVSGNVALALHWQRKEYEAALQRPLIPAHDFERRLPLWYSTLWYRAADEFGNVTKEQRSWIFVIPWGALVPVLVLVGWLLLAVILVALASQFQLVMRWLQYKHLRKGLWFVLSWRSMQRLLLRPYRRRLAHSGRSAKLGFRFAGSATGKPTSWPEVAALLGEEGQLKLLFPPSLPSGECLRAFSRHLVTDPDSRRAVARSVPIVVEFRESEESGTRLEEAALAELEGKGDITDPELGNDLVRAGGFVFLFDAAGRVGGSGPQTAVRDFVKRHGPPRNLLLLGIGTEERTDLLSIAPSIKVYADSGAPGTSAASESARAPRESG